MAFCGGCGHYASACWCPDEPPAVPEEWHVTLRRWFAKVREAFDIRGERKP